MSIPQLYGSTPLVAAQYPAPAEAFGPSALAELLAIARARRTLIFGVASAVVALTLIVLVLWPSRYVATSTVVLEGRRNAVTDQSAVLSSLPTDPASLQNQIQILTSRDLAGRVVDRMGLDKDTEFAPTTLFGGSVPAGARRRALTIDAFLSRLSVDVVGLSTTIEVSFASRDPEKAAAIANAIADAYTQSQIQAKIDAAERASGWLSVRIGQLAAQVRDAEVAVAEYKAQHHLFEAPDGTPLIDQQVLSISSQLVQARADLAQKEASHGRVDALASSGHGADASEVVASPLIVQLRQQEAELTRQAADLETRYGPRHPKMVQIESQRRDLEAKIAGEVRRIAGAVKSDVAAARSQVASLEASLTRAQKDAAGQSMARVALKSLEANAASTRSMYESFVTRLRETQAQDQIQMPDARVVSRASAPASPASPKRVLIFAASVPAGLLLGLLVALILERMAAAPAASPAAAVPPARLMQAMQHASSPAASVPPPPPVPAAAPETAPDEETAAPPPSPSPPTAQAVQTIQSVQPVAPSASVPVLAEFPDLSQITASPVPAADYVIDYPESGFARAIAALDRQIATASWQAPKVLMVTSPEAGGSKTTIALSLARAAAQRGQRVILIEGDALWPAAAAMMRIREVDGGIAEVVTGMSRLSRSILRDPKSEVMLLSWQRKPQRLRELLLSRRMQQLMIHLRSIADLIVIAAPPVSEAEGAAYLTFADGVLMVAAADERAQPAMLHALATLQALRAPTTGVALVG